MRIVDHEDELPTPADSLSSAAPNWSNPLIEDSPCDRSVTRPALRSDWLKHLLEPLDLTVRRTGRHPRHGDLIRTLAVQPGHDRCGLAVALKPSDNCYRGPFTRLARRASDVAGDCPLPTVADNSREPSSSLLLGITTALRGRRIGK